MNEFTREELEQIADTDHVQCGEASVLARMALAAMDSEPVGEFYEDGPLNWYQISEGDKVPDNRRIPLYRHAPPASVSVPDVIAPTVEAIKRVLPTSNPDEYAACIGADMWNACRAAMLQAGNSPVIPDGYMLVPKKLTAENGAKSALSGEFSETKFINCPECFGDDDCETCDGSGRIEITVPVSWTNIKAIWAKGIEHFTTVPHEENI
ncbi:hypothetical protein [Citrobacter sp. RHBSTW-00903]|uniref:hypothetical protein n=1 Tax=Citrobacter sp. RHBSTW-00903 TaxID=2742670 RepID=UPI002017AF66|nr:hypothetical protein [Citrobacter sp. RHBSTW-00903]